MTHDISRNPIHLGLGASAIVEPEFTGQPEWYAGYGARHEADGTEGRLVAMHHFSASWDVWEMHPEGSEVVLCTEGSIDLVQELDGEITRTTLTSGQYAINLPGVWHTADVTGPCTCLFITAGAGTQHRPR